MVYKSSRGLTSQGVQTSINFAVVVENILEDIRFFGRAKHVNAQPYINSVQHLFLTSFVYIKNDAVFYDELEKFNEMLMDKLNHMKTLAEKQDYIQNEYEVKSSDFLFMAIICALDRKHLLPKRTESATI